MAATTTDDVARALARWREVTAPLSHARNDSDAQLMLAHDAVRKEPTTETSPTDKVNAWSHGDFVTRVASFGVATWFAKPRCISPLACARFGWVNSACDMLRCAHCASVLCFKIDDALSDKGAQAVATQFARQLETSHDAACPWSHNASPESFTMLPLLGPSQVAAELRERTEALVATATARGDVKRALMEMRVSEQVLTKLLDGAGGGVNETALQMTLTKWRKRTDETVDERVLFHATLLSVCGWVVKQDTQDTHEAALVLSCEFCNRHVPVGATPEPVVAVAKEESKGEDEEEAPPPAKRQRISADDATKPINPIAEHRWFCPWVVAQRRRDAQDDARIRDVMTRVTSSTTPSSSDQPKPRGASLAEFVALPGWQQCALALGHLDPSSAQAATATSQASAAPAHVSALDALASVQSVLSLPDSFKY